MPNPIRFFPLAFLSAVLSVPGCAGPKAGRLDGPRSRTALASMGGDAGADDALISLAARGVAVSRIVGALGRKSGARIELRAIAPDEPVTLLVREEPLEAVLDQLILGHEWTWIALGPARYQLWDRAAWLAEQRGRRVERKFELRHTTPRRARAALRNVRSVTGEIRQGLEPNVLVVLDLPSAVQAMAEVLEEIDVRVVTRVFQLSNADPIDVARRVRAETSRAGDVVPDLDTRRVIVTDTPERLRAIARIIAQAEQR